LRGARRQPASGCNTRAGDCRGRRVDRSAADAGSGYNFCTRDCRGHHAADGSSHGLTLAFANGSNC
ncbi:MAG: hypothetical protein OXN91_01330, partial [Chloroflexota bacterium]|nr:hypothetical protein [Chloroflexota bacterium]